MRRSSRAWSSGLWLLAASLLSGGAEAQEVRIAGMSANLRASEVVAVALVLGGPARVAFEIVPTHVAAAPPPARVWATRATPRPEAIAALGPTLAEYTARLPAPARFGSFRGRAIAYDAAGHEIARSEAEWARSFPAHVRVRPAAPVLDVGAAATDAVFLIDVAGADAIDAIAVQTTEHASVQLGFGSLPYEAARDARVLGTSFPPVAVRLARRGPTTFELRVTVPASSPARALGLSRVYLRAQSGHTAETAPEPGSTIAISSSSPAPAALEVQVTRDRRDLIVRFRYLGPVIGRARTLYGFPVPNVEARVQDEVRLVRARCVPAESPLGDPPWGGEQMTCRLQTATRGDHPLGANARLEIVAGSRRVGGAPLSSLVPP